MKTKNKKITAIAAAAVILCGLAAGGMIMSAKIFGGIGKITDFEYLKIRVSGMRMTEEYEMVPDDGVVVISRYEIVYSGENTERRLTAETRVDGKEAIGVMNECGVSRWDGFSGKHPRGVSDGEMFSMEGSVNGGKKISAHGSENFPRGYRDFMRWLSAGLKD